MWTNAHREERVAISMLFASTPLGLSVVNAETGSLETEKHARQEVRNIVR